MQRATQLCTSSDHSVADPIELLRCFAALPLGAELCNGGQHDCQDALRQLLDALHDDLVRAAWPFSAPAQRKRAECSFLRKRAKHSGGIQQM